MGWSFNMDRSQTKASFIAELNRNFSEGYELLQHRVVGNNLWQLVKRPDGTKFICLCLMSRGNGRGGRGCSDHGWGYKGISEDMGPVEVDCPLSLLEQVDEPQCGWALEWRERVRAFHAARKSRPKPAAGLRVRYGDLVFTLKKPASGGARRGWVAEGSDGVTYRLKATQITQAEVVT